MEGVMMKERNEITEKTRLPLKLVILIGTGLVLGATWLTTLSVTAAGTKDKVDQIQAKFETHEATHEQEEKSIDERLSRMEGYFQRLLDNQ